MASSITLNNINEYTIECNPENINEKLIKAILEMRVNRVSLGVQSFDIDVLKTCNRNQSIENIYDALELLNNENINISIDFIP